MGRPWVARALVAAGYVTVVERGVLDRGCRAGGPAFVPREGAAPEGVIARIHDAGGIASMAHPGLLGRDELDCAACATRGWMRIEAYHTDHDARKTPPGIVALAERLGLAVSGGSDYHADHSHGAAYPGSVSLPRDAYEALVRLKPATTPRT